MAESARGSTRYRPRNSCLRCRDRRVGCDKIRPTCSRCQLARVECQYPVTLPGQAIQPSVQAQQQQQQPQQQQQQQHVVRGVSPVASSAPTSASGVLPRAAATNVRDAAAAVATAAASGRLIAEDPFQGLASPANLWGEAPGQGPAEQQASGGLELDRGYLTDFASGRYEYVGSSFWGLTNNTVDDLQRYLVHRNDLAINEVATELLMPQLAAPLAPPPQPITRRSQPSGPSHANRNPEPRNSQCPVCGHTLTMRCWLRSLPSKDLCNMLCLTFVQNVHPVVLLPHLQTFKREYDRFWTDFSDQDWHKHVGGIVAENPSFVPLLFSALFSAYVTTPSPADQAPEATSGLSSRLYTAAMATTALTGFPRRPSLYSLAAFLLVQNPLIREEQSNDAFPFISSAYRAAMGMGLHRDPSEFSIDPIKSEIRRRIWWHILHIDCMASMSSGVPPILIDKRLHSTRMISLENDCRSLGEQQSDGSTEVIVDLRHTVAVCRYRITSAIRETLYKQFEKPSTTIQRYMEMRQPLDALFDDISSTIHNLKQSSPSRSESTSQDTGIDRPWTTDSTDVAVVGFRQWAQTLLKLMLYKASCVMHHPIMREGKDRLWPAIRNSAIASAHMFIRLYVQVCKTPSFKPFHWLYPGTYQPLQPLALLLADMIEQPQSDQMALSRSLIDSVFILIVPGGGVASDEDGKHNHRHLTNSGREAWTMLARMRNKALRKAGWDPHVMLPLPYQPVEVLEGSEAHAIPGVVSSPNVGQSVERDVGGNRTSSSDDALQGDVMDGMNEFNWMEWDSILGQDFLRQDNMTSM